MKKLLEKRSTCFSVINEIIEKAEKRYKIEKEEKSFQRNGWSRKKALRRNLKKDFRKVCDWYLHIPFDDDFENGKKYFCRTDLVKVYFLPGNTD